MNRKTSWKETTVLKKSILLTLILAILIALSVSTFSLFNKTESVGTSSFSTKIFDVCRANPVSVPDTIEESDFIENSSPWIFMAFNSSAKTDDYDTLIDVTLINPVLNVPSLDGLRVGLYEQDVCLSTVPFSGNTAKLFIPNHFLSNVLSQKILSLQFFYNGQPISVNNPFVSGTTRFSAKVWGDNYIQTIIDSNWFYVKTYQKNKNFLQGILQFKGQSEISLEEIRDNPIGTPITLTINYYKQIGLVNAYMTILYDSYSYTYPFAPDAAYTPPNVIAIQNSEFPNGTFTVNSLLFNGVPCTEALPDSSQDSFIYRNFQTTDTGFQISITYTNGNKGIMIYVAKE